MPTQSPIQQSIPADGSTHPIGIPGAFGDPSFTFHSANLTEAATSLHGLATLQRELVAKGLKIQQDIYTSRGQSMPADVVHTFNVETIKAVQLDTFATQFEAVASRVPASKSAELANRMKLAAQYASAAGRTVSASDLMKVLVDAKTAVGDISSANSEKIVEVMSLLSKAEIFSQQSFRDTMLEASLAGRQVDAAIIAQANLTQKNLSETFDRLVKLTGSASASTTFDSAGLEQLRTQVLSSSNS